jgi:hypothetical protein
VKKHCHALVHGAWCLLVRTGSGRAGTHGRDARRRRN